MCDFGIFFCFNIFGELMEIYGLRSRELKWQILKSSENSIFGHLQLLSQVVWLFHIFSVDVRNSFWEQRWVHDERVKMAKMQSSQTGNWEKFACVWNTLAVFWAFRTREMDSHLLLCCFFFLGWKVEIKWKRSPSCRGLVLRPQMAMVSGRTF